MTHNDQPALDCCLDRTHFRDLILQQIVVAKPPKTIGVHGTWGTGKTSLLKQLYADLGGKHSLSEEELAAFEASNRSTEAYENFKPIWFEAWQYQHESNILAVLLKEIRDQLSWGWQAWDTAKKAVDVAAISVLQNIKLTVDGFGFNFGQQVRDARSRAKELQAQDLAMPIDSVTHKRLLKKAIDELLNLRNILGGERNKENTKRAVIFIDDLDRCEPDAAFRILESIKVYLNLENCIFVLGMDLREVERILAQRYERLFDADMQDAFLRNHARLYLEKICQDVYHIPVLNKGARANYLRKLLHEYADDDSPFAPITDRLCSIAEEYEALPPFPRSIKIFANVLAAHGKLPGITQYMTESGEDAVKAFYILAYLYAFHPDVYHLCKLYEDFYPEQFITYVVAPQKDKDKQHELLSKIQLSHFPSSDPAGLDSETEDSVEAYPHKNLRQVLWITKLVKASEDMEEALKKFEFNG